MNDRVMKPKEKSEDQLLGELNARYRAPLIGYFFRRVRHHAEAEDLTQELFLRLVRREGGATIENSDLFIFKTAANLLRDRARRNIVRQRDAHVPLPEHGPLFSGALVEYISPDRVLLSKENLKEVLGALGELNERTRSIFILYRLENMRHREIAALLGISVSAVEKHMIKAIAHLTQRFCP